MFVSIGSLVMVYVMGILLFGDSVKIIGGGIGYGSGEWWGRMEMVDEVGLPLRWVGRAW